MNNHETTTQSVSFCHSFFASFRRSTRRGAPNVPTAPGPTACAAAPLVPPPAKQAPGATTDNGAKSNHSAMILYPLLHLWDMISTMIWYDFIFVDIISTITLWYNSGHNNPWRIHVAAIYANMTGVYWWEPWHTIYSSTMDPMGNKMIWYYITVYDMIIWYDIIWYFMIGE